LLRLIVLLVVGKETSGLWPLDISSHTNTCF
jgi:hypothetical protein